MVKVLFLQEIWFPYQGVMNLSASLKEAGHSTDIAIGKDDYLLEEIRGIKPEIVAFPITTSHRNFMLRMAKKIKEKKWPVLIVIGGYDCSFFPEMIEQNKDIDLLCRGEGNEALVELCNCLAKKKDYSQIKNLWVRKGDKVIKNELAPFVDLNKRPFDDQEIYRKYRYFRDIEFAQVMVGRGCPYNCSYCFNHKYREMYFPVSKQYCSLREPERVIEEILVLKNKYGFKNIFFNDSTLAYNKGWLDRFLQLYAKKVDLPFSINACANEVNEEFCRQISRTNRCYLIRMGVEAGNENFRMKVLRKTQTSNQKLEVAAALLHKYNLKVSYQFMMGLPGETLEMVEETLILLKKLSVKDSICAGNIFKPFPKLDITEYGLTIGQYDPKLIGGDLIGNKTLNFYDCFRKDKEGQKILRLSRFCHFYIKFPFLRPFIKGVLIKIPDNFVYKTIWKFSDIYFTNRHHINASYRYLFKYLTRYAFKNFR